MFKQGYKAYQFAKVFKEYKNSSEELEKIKLSKLLVNIMNEQGGLFLKVGQYLGTDQAQVSTIQALSFREEGVLNLKQFQKNLKNEIGDSSFNKISLEEKWVKSASIGQVQKAKLSSGEDVVIKLQYPDIEKTLKSQLSLLNLMPTQTPAKKWGVDIEGYKKFINHLLDEELNYPHEMEKMQKAYKLFKDYEFIKVPKVFTNYSSKKVITSEYLNGVTIAEMENKPYEVRRKVAEKFLATYLLMLANKFVQGDSNHGNFLFHPAGDWIGLIDFGQFVAFDQNETYAILHLIFNMIQKNNINYLSYFVQIGFDAQKIVHLEKQLGLLAHILFEPFIKNAPFNLKDWHYAEKIEKVLGENKWLFRSAGNQNFFLIMKSFMGFKNLISKLDVIINWQQVFLEVYSNLSSDFLAYHPPQLSLQNSSPDIGKMIRLKVSENGEENVRLNLPIQSLFNLKDLIDADVLLNLEEQGINVDEIIEGALKSGATVQKLFEYKSGAKDVLIEII